MFDWLEALVTDSPVTYLVVWLGVTFDAVVPDVPSESLLITGGVLAAADFPPGARTAAMLSAGWLGLPVRRFYAFVVPGGLLWSAFTTLLGYAGGSAFEGSLWLPLGASLAVAVVLGLGAEALERRSRRGGGGLAGHRRA